MQARDLVQTCDNATAAAKTLARLGLISRWQAAQLLLGRSTFTLGKYRLIQMLGRGGMGSVCLAEHVTMNRRVVLKIISPRAGKDPASLERFLGEARAAAALDHPNIVQAYSVDNEGDRYYLVMEYVEGMDLQRLVEAEGPLDCERAVDYIRQAADGLDHAHQRSMIHRDIKPANLLVNPQGVIKILDMGLAKLTDDDKPANGEQDERVLGSVDYLAPSKRWAAPTSTAAPISILWAARSTFCLPVTRRSRKVPCTSGSLNTKRKSLPASVPNGRRCPPNWLGSAEDDGQGAGRSLPDGRRGEPAVGGVAAGHAQAAARDSASRAKPLDDTTSEAVFDAEFEKEAARSPLDLLSAVPIAGLDAKLATLTSSNPNIATLDAKLVLAPRREATSSQSMLWVVGHAAAHARGGLGGPGGCCRRSNLGGCGVGAGGRECAEREEPAAVCGRRPAFSRGPIAYRTCASSGECSFTADGRGGKRHGGVPSEAAKVRQDQTAESRSGKTTSEACREEGRAACRQGGAARRGTVQAGGPAQGFGGRGRPAGSAC